MVYLLLFLGGFVAYLVSTLAGGGGALIMLPIVGQFVPANVVAPIVNLGNLIGRPARLFLFWKDIDWSIVRFYLPAAILGTLLGAYVFVQIDGSWMQVLLGTFLILSALPISIQSQLRFPPMKKTHFLPLGFIVSLISTIFGATGAILNPFYLKIGLVKESMIATKTANSFLVGIVQVGSYAFLGALEGELWAYGASIGMGAWIGNVLGKRYLKKMSAKTFRRAVYLLMFVSGISLLYRGLQSF